MKNEEILKENNGNKFDIVLMNAPYDKSMHLKFLEKTIKIADKVVSIQPCRWLQETVSKNKKNSQYNKYKQSISEHIKDFEIIDFDTVLKLFNVQSTELAIYYCNKEGGYDYNKISSNNIVEKVLDYIENNLCDIENNKKDGYRVRISKISGMAKIKKNVVLKDIVFKDGKYNDKWWYNYYQKNGSSKQTEEITASIKFNTEKEGYNFIKSFKTDFVKYIESHLITDVSVNEHKILWMGNAKHPRTGNIGYIDEWTNEDFYEFFNISKEYQNKIETFIKDYDNRYNNWKKEHDKK